MEAPDFIFNENFIKEKLLSYNSPERCSLDDEVFTKSAVLFLIMKYENKPYDLVLFRRTKHEMDKHSGEMSFPGGKVDPQDKTIEETALRECEEELGIPKSKIRVLGSFDDHITPKGFIITPIVGYIDENQTLTKQDDEVQEIVNVPIDFLADKKKYRERTYVLKGDTIAVGKYNYRASNGIKYVIFGATSHIIVNFIDLVYNLGLMQPGARRLTCTDLRDKIQKNM